MILAFIGPPASGKGTQARLLSKEGYHCLSMGFMLRSLSSDKTPEARCLYDKINQGVILDDAFVIDIIDQALGSLSESKRTKLVFDGVPRTLGQAKLLDEVLKRHALLLDWAVYFGSDPYKFQEVVGQRISSRYHCLACGASYGVNAAPKESGQCDLCSSRVFAHRQDDRPEIVVKRLEAHHKIEEEILTYYRKDDRLQVVNSLASVEEVKKNLEGLKARGVSVSF